MTDRTAAERAADISRKADARDAAIARREAAPHAYTGPLSSIWCVECGRGRTAHDAK